MSVGSVSGGAVRAPTVVNQANASQPASQKAAQAFVKETQESPAVTKQEANKGDIVAKRKLAKDEETSESSDEKQAEANRTSPAGGQSSGESEAQGQIVSAVA